MSRPNVWTSNAVRRQAEAGFFVLCPQIRHFSLTMPPSTSAGIDDNKEPHLQGPLVFAPSGSRECDEEDPENLDLALKGGIRQAAS